MNFLQVQNIYTYMIKFQMHFYFYLIKVSEIFHKGFDECTSDESITEIYLHLHL